MNAWEVLYIIWLMFYPFIILFEFSYQQVIFWVYVFQFQLQAYSTAIVRRYGCCYDMPQI